MKHKFIAKRYWKDQSTAMGQSDEMAKSFDDVINLSLGDPDMTTPEPIIEAAFRDAKAGHTKYTDFRGDPELRAEICRYYEKNFGMPVRDEEAVSYTHLFLPRISFARLAMTSLTFILDCVPLPV